MKARVKATGEIVEVKIIDGLSEEEMYVEKFGEMSGRVFHITELDFDNLDYPDYWARLEHQYAGMAMQGLMTILPNIGGLEGRTPKDEIVDIATATAHALVEELKGKEEKK